MCFEFFVKLPFFAIDTAPELFSYIFTDLSILTLKVSISKFRTILTSVTASERAIYSAKVELSVTVFC